MNEGFLPFLDNAEFSLGAIDEPDDDTVISVHTTFGEVEGNAIGIDEFCNHPFVNVFSWHSLDEESIAKLAEEEGISMDAIESEIDLDEQVCILENVIPLFEVQNIDHNTGDVFL